MMQAAFQGQGPVPLGPACGVELRTPRAGRGTHGGHVWLVPGRGLGWSHSYTALGPQDGRAGQHLPGFFSGGPDPKARVVRKGLEAFWCSWG